MKNLWHFGILIVGSDFVVRVLGDCLLTFTSRLARLDLARSLTGWCWVFVVFDLSFLVPLNCQQICATGRASSPSGTASVIFFNKFF